jgi:GGDEF domain-containing protein
VSLFQKNPHWDSVTVASSGRPVGIVRRDTLLTLLSKPLYPEVYNRKPIERVMDASPLMVNARARLDQVSRLVTGGSHVRINEDFIICRHGEYLGMGRTIELLRQITAQQVQVAKQSNPLTLLPGNREIEGQLSRLMALRVPFALCHGDLDHFKSFNDEYGYRHGDQVLLHVADLFRRAAIQTIDFVGHLGGDDYILMMRAPDWRRRLSQLFDSFSASIPNFYSAEHRRTGVIQGMDRDGNPHSYPLMTLSIGAVDVQPDRFADPEAVMQSLRRTKSLAKGRQGNALVFDSETEVSVSDLSPSGRFSVVQSA